MSEQCFDLTKRLLEFGRTIAQASRCGSLWGVEVLFPTALKGGTCSARKERLEDNLGSFVTREYLVRQHEKRVDVALTKTVRLFNESRPEDSGGLIEALTLPRKSCCGECREGANQRTNDGERSTEPERLLGGHVMPNETGH
jgi:hypothetical protein